MFVSTQVDFSTLNTRFSQEVEESGVERVISGVNGGTAALKSEIAV
jgi:hypothetical protein